MKPIQVGLLGMGTVGSGTFNVLQRNQEEIKRRAGRGIEISMVADLDIAKAQACVPPMSKWSVMRAKSLPILISTLWWNSLAATALPKRWCLKKGSWSLNKEVIRL